MAATQITNPDPFSAGGWNGEIASAEAPSQAADYSILTMFRDWLAMLRAVNTRALSMDEMDREMEIVNDLARQIYDARVNGLVGLAIKSFLAVYEVTQEDVLYNHPDDPCAIGPYLENDDNYSPRFISGENRYTQEAQLFMDRQAVRGLAASAVAFLPELEPLLRHFIASPVVLPPPKQRYQGFELFQPKRLAAGCDYAIRVVGEAMAPRYRPGEILHVAKTGCTPAPGDDIVLHVADGSARLVTMLREGPTGGLVFKHCNAVDLAETSDVHVVAPADIVSIDAVMVCVHTGPGAEAIAA